MTKKTIEDRILRLELALDALWGAIPIELWDKIEKEYPHCAEVLDKFSRELADENWERQHED